MLLGDFTALQEKSDIPSLLCNAMLANLLYKLHNNLDLIVTVGRIIVIISFIKNWIIV